MALPVSDNFNRANGGLGANWTTIAGASNNPQISSQVVQPEIVGTGSIALYTAETFPDNQTASLSLVTLNTTNGRVVGIVLRGITSARTQYEFLVSGPFGATATLTIRRYNAGVQSPLTASAATETVNSGDLLTATCSGTILTLKINGNQRLSYDDVAAPIGSGTPGILVFTSVGVVGDAQIDNFYAGELSTAITGLGQKHMGFNYARPYL